jgi:HD-GYP domain-containing protein (c-di-GMP phosphodiesterase class II)
MSQILLLGSDRERVAEVRAMLRQDGHQVNATREIDDWRSRERELLPDLVVAAVESTDGILTAPQRKTSRGFPAPLLFVQHEADFCREVFLAERLVDRITSPFLSQDLLARVDALVRVRRVIQRNPPLGFAEESEDDEPAAAGQWRGLGRRLTALLGSRIPRCEKPLTPYLEVAAQVADWADRRDAFAPGHAERVTSFCAMIGEGLRLGAHETASLLRAAMLHDIGKVALPVEVLHQKTPLEESQMRLIRTHPQRGAALLQALDRDEEVAETVLYHHERPDGLGYYGIDGDNVPRTARILAVAEVYDAMTSSRVREPLESARALELLEASKGENFDTDAVEALVDKMRPQPHSIPLTTDV